MDFKEEMFGYASRNAQPENVAQQDTPAQEETPIQPTTDAAMAEPSGEQAALATTEVTSIPPAEQAKAPEAPDYNKIVEEISGGRFKSAEDFKASLPKFEQFDDVVKEKQEIEAKLAVNPFANDYVKNLNELVKGGATPDQINGYIKINQLGDLNDLSPVDAKVYNLVLNEGYSEKSARMKVNREFDLAQFEEGSEDRELLEEELKVSAKKDIAALQKSKADLSKIDNSEQENKRLVEIAQKEQHAQNVKRIIPQVAAQVGKVGSINLTGKEGDDALDYTLEYNTDFKQGLSSTLENWFIETGKPINEETLAEAHQYANALYLAKHWPDVAKDIYNKAEMRANERAANKFENRSGLAPETVNTPSPTIATERQSFLAGIAG